jgi:hypothetical protein
MQLASWQRHLARMASQTLRPETDGNGRLTIAVVEDHKRYRGRDQGRRRSNTLEPPEPGSDRIARSGQLR